MLLAKTIVAPASDNNRRAAGQVRHRVPESWTRRLARGFDGNEVALNHLAIHSDGLKVLELVHQLAICLFASEEVDSIHNHITLKNVNDFCLLCES